VFDALVTADVLVDDVDATVARLVEVLGLPDPKPSWTHDFPGYTYKATFCRIHPSLTVAPTLFEVIAPAPSDGPAPAGVPSVDANLEACVALQGPRPVHTHATVFATRDFPALVSRLEANDVRHRIDPVTTELPFPRLFLGMTADDITAYDPAVDGGLFVEVVPFDVVTGHPSPVAPFAPGTMVRIVARTFLVADLDATLAALRHTLGWPGAVGIEERPDGRRVVLVPTLAESASLELVEPTGGRLGDFFDRYGPGPHAIRIGVQGLDAKLDELRARGVGYEVVAEGPIVEVDPDPLGGIVVELCELDDQEG
jgi:hypothetical protein